MRIDRRLAWMALGLVAALASSAVTSAADSPGSGDTVSLFNGRDLSGWHTFIAHKDGADPKTDPKGVFKVEDGIIHVSGEEFGCLTTNEEYQNYRLKFEFKWGEKRYPPREKAARDSGVLLHCVGPDKVWTKSIECQIQEHDCGDFHMVGGTSIDINGKTTKSRVIKTKDAEKPSGEWNTIECICDGGSITNIVNGVVVNVGTNASETKGKILFQSEGAEVYYRKIELTPLTKAAP